MSWVSVVACGIALLSGCAALLFETLWFHAASIAFGNGVWASSIVLSSFMAGLALGNWGAGRVGARLVHPLRVYGVLELAIGVGGAALAIGFASLSESLVNAVLMGGPRTGLGELHATSTQSRLVTLPLWLLGSDAFEAEIAASLTEPDASSASAFHLRGVNALADRRYAEAASLFAEASRATPPIHDLGLGIFARCMAGDLDGASALAREDVRVQPADRANDALWRFLRVTFGLPDPREPRAP